MGYTNVGATIQALWIEILKDKKKYINIHDPLPNDPGL